MQRPTTWQRLHVVKRLTNKEEFPQYFLFARLLDHGFYAPTVYFPLIVEEALMIEPTETESPETLDSFIDAMNAIAREAREDPELVKSAPHDTPVRRIDEARAARQPILRWRPRTDD